MSLWRRILDALSFLLPIDNTYYLEEEWIESQNLPPDQLVYTDENSIPGQPVYVEENIPPELLDLANRRRQYIEDLLRRWHSLSLREQQVAQMICYQYTTDEIALQLFVSNNTVKTHVRAVLRKFDVHSRSELRLLLSEFDFNNWNNPVQVP